jgi:structure-specific recognition protein 1
VVGADRGSADEDSESADEDFDDDSDSDVAEEFDSNHASSGESGDEAEDLGDTAMDVDDEPEPEPPKKKSKTKK